MPVLQKLKKYLFSIDKREVSPVTAYNNWALSYDNQPDNLMLALDNKIFNFFIEQIDIKNKIIIDIGCGTGRHWKKIFDKKPGKLIGFDVSTGMLKVLSEKFPLSETYVLANNRLTNLNNESCDLIISTLTIAHIKNIEEAFKEWIRVLKPNGSIIITDYHPDALAKGGNRTFKHNGLLISIINYIHDIKTIKNITSKNKLSVLGFKQEIIDDSVKHYYEKQKAVDVFERFYGTYIIYGIYLKKENGIK